MPWQSEAGRLTGDGEPAGVFQLHLYDFDSRNESTLCLKVYCSPSI